MFSVIIQAGGKSSRMGTDKLFIPFRGRILIEWVIERLANLTDDLIIISNQHEKLKYLNQSVYPDAIKDVGPLAGLYTGLKYARYDSVVMVACDMPFVNSSLLIEEVRLLEEMQMDVVIPVPGGKTEPLHAAYRRGTCLPVIEAGIRSGMRRLIEWHSLVRVHLMEDAQIRKFDPTGLAFMNINNPEDALLAEQVDLEDDNHDHPS
jgi:molybdopterin-guanine dinucleotide biosynthesis protein A